MKETALSLCQTWIGKDGRYYDVILKGGKLMNNYDLTQTTNPFSYGEDAARNWCIFTLGGTLKASKDCNIYGEFSKYAGELTNNLQYNVGARWKI